MRECHVILQVGAEGGDLTLYGARTEAGWRFSRHVIDQTPLLVLDEPAIEHRSEIVDSWEDALGLLDRYPWHRLYPLEVHPEFREQVWQEVKRRMEGGHHHRLDDWREVCAVERSASKNGS